MADYAPHNTARVKMFYSVAGFSHNLVVRAQRGAATTPEGLASKVRAILTAMNGCIYEDFLVSNWAYAEEDSVFFLPFSSDVWEGGNVAVAGRSATQRALQLRYEGRSLFGGRTAFVLFGTSYNLVADVTLGDFRITVAEDANVAAGHTALTELSPAFGCGDGQQAIWYPYANLKFNDEMVRKARG